MAKKICSKCNREINEIKDDWYRTTLFEKTKQTDEIYFHRQCYKDFHKDKFKEEYNKKIKLLAPMLKGLFNGKKKEEIVEYA